MEEDPEGGGGPRGWRRTSTEGVEEDLRSESRARGDAGISLRLQLVVTMEMESQSVHIT